MIDIYAILQKYSPTTDIFSEEEDDAPSRRIKEIVFNDLDEIDRRLLLLYAEVGSYRELAKIIGVSATSCFLKIKEIKKKINDKLTDN